MVTVTLDVDQLAQPGDAHQKKELQVEEKLGLGRRERRAVVCLNMWSRILIRQKLKEGASIYTSLYSLTRFGDISPPWLILKVFEHTVRGLLSMWKIFDPILANFLLLNKFQ